MLSDRLAGAELDNISAVGRSLTEPAVRAMPVVGRPVGCQNSIVSLTSGFLLAREGPDRCLSRLVQNLISRRSLRIHSASSARSLRTRGSAA